MTKIKNQVAYPRDTVITDNDFVIGSDGDSIAKTTKNFFFGNIRDYLLEGLPPEAGGTLKYTEITNNTGSFTTPADLANSLIPSLTVLRSNIVVFTVNGNRFLLKLQNLAVGSVETPITNDDFITIIGFEKLGDGQGVLKGYNETTKLHEYYSLKSDGNDISIVADNILINPKEGVNLGDGQEVYKGLNGTTKLHEFRTTTSVSPIIAIGESVDGNKLEFAVSESPLRDFIKISQISPDNSVNIVLNGNFIEFSVNTTWLQNWVSLNQSLFCNLISSCPVIFQANNDNYTQPFSPSTSYVLNVLDNDVLGANTPVNIISIDTTGLPPTVATVSITAGNQSITLTMGTSFSPGTVYSFTYTIQDSTMATSVATVYFQDLS